MTRYDWVPINDGIDRQRDGVGRLYAQAGPETGNRWSWSVFRWDEDGSEMIRWGRANGERAALDAADRVLAELAGSDESDWTDEPVEDWERRFAWVITRLLAAFPDGAFDGNLTDRQMNEIDALVSVVKERPNA